MAKQQLSKADYLAIIQQSIVQYADAGGAYIALHDEDETAVTIVLPGVVFNGETGNLEVEPDPLAGVICHRCGQHMKVFGSNGAYGPSVYLRCDRCLENRQPNPTRGYWLGRVVAIGGGED